MRITCVIDNCVSFGSRLWGEHGLSFWIETAQGNLLWDTGQTETVSEHNLRILKLDINNLSALALSHAHGDHTGGLLHILRQRPSLPVYAHQEIYGERYNLREESARPMGLDRRHAEIEPYSSLRLSAQPQELLPQVWTTGSIAPRLFPMGASKSHVIRGAAGWLPDPYLDDLSLVLSVDDGIVLLCGCCHAGLRNTVATVRAQYDEKLVAIIGGTHLHDANGQEMGEILAMLEAEGSPRLYLNHCSGDKALTTLKETFGDQVSPCPAGTMLDF